MAERALIDVHFEPLPTIVAEGYFVTAAYLDNMVEPVTQISQFVSQKIGERFDSQGDGTWPEHAEATVARWGEHELLQLSHTLRDEVTSEDAWDVARVSHGAVATFDPGDAFWLYGQFHIEGAQVGNWVLPVRDFLDLGTDVEDEAENIFDKWVDIGLALF